jgi:PAS domain S-box-containing protein
MSADSEVKDCKYSMLPEVLQDIQFDLLSRLDFGIICLDKDDKVIHLNKVFRDLIGIMDDAAIGRGLNDLSSTLFKNPSSFFNQLLFAKQQSNFERQGLLKIVSNNGCLKYFSCDFVPYFDNGTVSNGTLCLLKDETVKTVCSNRYFVNDCELNTSHLPFVSFLWKGDDVWSVEYVSDNIVQFGYDPEEFISGTLSYSDIIHPDCLSNLMNEVNVFNGSNFSQEYMILTAHGEPRWVLERSYAIRDDNNNITHFHGAILDINDRKKVEHELKFVHSLEKSLSRLWEKAISCSDVNSLMNYTVKLVAKTLDMKYCSIMEKLPGDNFLLRYGHGFSDWCIGSAIVDKNEGSQAGFTIFSGKPLIMEDIENETRFKTPHFLYEHGVVSGASVIIGSRKEPFGTLCVYTDKKRHFTEPDISFLQSASNVLTETLRLRESFSSLELYKNLINQSNDYIMVLDTVSKKFIYTSARVIQDIGYSESEIKAQNIFEKHFFMKSFDILDVIRKAADEGSFLVESEFTRKNGTSFPVDISFSFVENKGKIYLVLIGHDITEKKKSHKRLSESETKLSAIFDNASDLICLSDVDGTILQINRTMANILGYQGHELPGLSIEDIVAPDFCLDIPQLLDEIKIDGLITIELDLLKKNGDVFPMEVKVQSIEYSGQKHLLSIGRDISDRRVLEKAIRDYSEQLEYSNEIKSIFADVTSHDLVSSISFIEGFAEYLSEIEDDREKINILYHIRDGTDKLRKTIDCASVFARMSSSADMDQQTLDLGAFFRESLKRLSNEMVAGDIKVTLVSPSCYPAYINPIIEEVFFNLLSNAIKYSPPGSEVIVDIVKIEDKWKVSVSDFGPGISDKDKSRIFDRFSRVSASGVNGKGLGLAIAKMALKCHGEELHVTDNENGKGSTFWFNVRVSNEFETFQ